MEKERVKYHNIGLKNKKLRDEFMILGRMIGSKNADFTMEYLLKFENISPIMAETLFTSFEKQKTKFSTIDTYLFHLLSIDEGLLDGSLRLTDLDDERWNNTYHSND